MGRVLVPTPIFMWYRYPVPYMLTTWPCTVPIVISGDLCKFVGIYFIIFWIFQCICVSEEAKWLSSSCSYGTYFQTSVFFILFSVSNPELFQVCSFFLPDPKINGSFTLSPFRRAEPAGEPLCGSAGAASLPASLPPPLRPCWRVPGGFSQRFAAARRSCRAAWQDSDQRGRLD